MDPWFPHHVGDPRGRQSAADDELRRRLPIVVPLAASTSTPTSSTS
ncbi:hypothetical protein [Streptomyces omiyaensis]